MASMRHRFHSNLPLTSGALIELAGDELHHARVLRLREGEPVEVFDGRGMAFAGATEGPASVRLGDALPSRESPLAVHLAMSVINLDKFELVLQKATELGPASITSGNGSDRRRGADHHGLMLSATLRSPPARLRSSVPINKICCPCDRFLIDPDSDRYQPHQRLYQP